MESMTGQLLVATPTLKDPNFDRTVVLLVAHEPGGALGVVLNRATEVPVADVLGDWGDLAGDPAVLFEGGPVQPESAICLARTRPEVQRASTASTRSPARSARSTSPPTRTGCARASPGSGSSPATPAGPPASWRRRSRPAPGSCFDALPGDPFVDRPDDLWAMVLRRQGGIMAAVAHFPPDVA